MSRGTVPDIGKLTLDEDIDEDLFASPDSGANTHKHTPASTASSSATKNPAQQQQQRHAGPKQSKQDIEEAREAQLRAELEKVRSVNQVIENVTASLTKAQDNMNTVHQTVNNASTLLATWTRILSQTEHNQRLILNPNWQGATQDLEDVENEDLRRTQEAERRAFEEQRRREEAARKAEEEERKRAAGEAKTAGRGLGRTRSVRGTKATILRDGRGRGISAGTAGTTRGSSGYGRVTSSTSRGRGRGLG